VRCRSKLPRMLSTTSWWHAPTWDVLSASLFKWMARWSPATVAMRLSWQRLPGAQATPSPRGARSSRRNHPPWSSRRCHPT
jgi:hypothetical protein